MSHHVTELGSHCLCTCLSLFFYLVFCFMFHFCSILFPTSNCCTESAQNEQDEITFLSVELCHCGLNYVLFNNMNLFVLDISLSQPGISSSQGGTETEQVVEAATDADAEQLRDGLDTLHDLRSPHKQAAKSSAKSKKRSTDRKRKGSSWYNVRSADVSPLLLVSCHPAVFMQCCDTFIWQQRLKKFRFSSFLRFNFWISLRNLAP